MAQQTATADVEWTWTRANKAEKAIKRARARRERLAAAETTVSPQTSISAFEQNRRDAARAEFESFAFIPVNEEYVNVANTTYDDPKGHVYSVRVERGKAVECSCPHDTYREGKCKHRRAVEGKRESGSGRGTTDASEATRAADPLSSE